MGAEAGYSITEILVAVDRVNTVLGGARLAGLGIRDTLTLEVTEGVACLADTAALGQVTGLMETAVIRPLTDPS